STGARLLVITPFDKTALPDIEKAIKIAELGLTPSNDGNLIRINIPALTEERCKDLTKIVGKYSEESKVQIRNIRRDANEQLKSLEKDAVITEDEVRTSQHNVQKETDSYIARIDELITNIESELNKKNWKVFVRIEGRNS